MADTTGHAIPSFVMRRVSLAALMMLLAVPTALGAVGGAGAEDGTLSIRNANAVIQLNVRGSVLGRFDGGQITISDPNLDDARVPQVRGWEDREKLSDRKTRYSGKKVRFRIVGGRFPATITGLGIDLSAVGQGTVVMNGHDRYAPGDVGEYSLNLDDYKLIPLEKIKVALESDSGS